MNASLMMFGLSLVACCLIFDKGTMAEDSGWMVLVPHTRLAGEAINSGTPIPATLADKVPNEDAWIVGAYDNGYMKMVKIQVTGSNTYTLIASKYEGAFAGDCWLKFSSYCFTGEDQLTPAYEVQLVAEKAQCPNEDWEYGSLFCEEEYSDFDDSTPLKGRLYCCERKIPEECRDCMRGHETCTEKCGEVIQKTDDECKSSNDKHEWQGSAKHPWEEKLAVICILKKLIQDSVCAKDGESCKENYCCDGFLCDGQVCRKDETPCRDVSSKNYKCKDVVAEYPDRCKFDPGAKALCPVTCGCRKCNIHGCAMD